MFVLSQKAIGSMRNSMAFLLPMFFTLLSLPYRSRRLAGDNSSLSPETDFLLSSTTYQPLSPQQSVQGKKYSLHTRKRVRTSFALRLSPGE